MNCAYHAEVPNAAYCIRCGRALCNECTRTVKGSVYCETCLADLLTGKTRAAVFGTNPGAAFALGLIPGVGAIYNGEFLKAAVHVLIFGTLVSLLGLPTPLMAMMTFAFYWYMPFEAYYTAKKRKYQADGIELETPIDRLQQQFSSMKERELWGGIALVIIGGLLLLGNLNLFNLAWIGRVLWPAVLVGVGIWLLKKRQGKAA
jgi:hypothetical protein